MVKVWYRVKIYPEDPAWLKTKCILVDSLEVMERELKDKILHYKILEEKDFHQLTDNDMHPNDRKFLNDKMYPEGEMPQCITTM